MKQSQVSRTRDSYGIRHTKTDSQMSKAFLRGVKICFSIDLYGQVTTTSTHCGAIIAYFLDQETIGINMAKLYLDLKYYIPTGFFVQKLFSDFLEDPRPPLLEEVFAWPNSSNPKPILRVSIPT